jgi:PAS domain S-box-containing protein
MTGSLRQSWGERQRVARACLLVLAVIATLLAAAKAGWSPPLPSAWILLAIAMATRVAGVPGGIAAIALSVAFAMHTQGFTIDHSSEVSLWGAPRQRVLAFGIAAAIVVKLVLRWQVSRAALPSALDVWHLTSGNESCSWLIAELEADGAVRRVNASGADLLGYSPAELHGRSFLSMTYSPDRDQAGLALMRLRRGRRTEPVSVRLMTATGRERSFVGRAFRVSEAGHVVVTAAIPEVAVQHAPVRDDLAKGSPFGQPTVASR